MLTSRRQTLRVQLHAAMFASRFSFSLRLMGRSTNGGGEMLEIVPRFESGRHENSPYPGTCLTNLFVKEVEFGASLLTM